MQDFPLYNSLELTCKHRDLTDCQKHDFFKNIQFIDQEGYKHIYSLIKIYSVKNDNCKQNILPYNGIKNDQDITFDMELLPLKLRQIIYKFTLKHIRKMENERKRYKY